MLQQICAEECSSIPRGRVLAHAVGLEEKARAQIIFAVMGLCAEQVDKWREAFRGQRGECVESSRLR